MKKEYVIDKEIKRKCPRCGKLVNWYYNMGKDLQCSNCGLIDDSGI
jgi:endogenous inhibitor of DNA gyrase (YacG/DUF329 family)